MKRFNLYKTVQLIILLGFLAVCLWLIFFRRELYHEIAQDPDLRLVSGLLLACLGLNLVFIFLDFSALDRCGRRIRELSRAVYADPMDILERYGDKPVPEDVGCVMLELSNAWDVSEGFGHTRLIRDFSNLLKMSSVSLCCVGCSGDGKFLAVFEHSSRQQIDAFLQRVERKVNMYNEENPEVPMAYRWGVAFDEPEKLVITQLAALADRRMK